VTDTPDCAGPLLDLVEADEVRVQDPMMHQPAAIIPSTNHKPDTNAKVIKAAGLLTAHPKSEEPKP
jgi:hypothetical protein